MRVISAPLQKTIIAGMAYLAAIGLAQAADTPIQRGGSIIFTIGADPPTSNPAITTGIPDGLVGCILYQGLTTVTSDEQIIPMLAKSWTVSPDGKTYDFTLNKANWHDGKPFTSADVKFSLIEVNTKYSSAFAGAGKLIQAIDTPAPDRAIVHLSEPFGPFLLSLACAQGGAILPEHVFKGSNPLQNPASTIKPIGLGAFKMTEWLRGDHIRFVKNDDYREAGKPYLDEVIGKIIPQPSARTQALQAGEVDHIMYYYVPTNDYETVRKNPKLRLTPGATPPGITIMFVNMTRKPYDDKRVRQALFMATDRDFLLKNAFLGAGTVGTMPFTNRIKWAANPEIDFRKMYPYDVAKANALLDEAGLKRGPDGIRFRANLVYAADSVEYPLAASAVKSMWRDIGVDVNNDGGERTTALKRVYQDHDFDVSIADYSSYGDPALGISRAFVTSSLGKTFGNGSGYSNPALDALFDQAEHQTTLEDRGAIYRKIQATLADELPIYTIREREVYDATTPAIHGIERENHLITWIDAWRSN